VPLALALALAPWGLGAAYPHGHANIAGPVRSLLFGNLLWALL
jgi:hypothetical protein